MFNPNDHLRGFSRALYANWIFSKPDRLLIDCGEGCATSLDGAAGSVERVFLTHGHIDHVGGLPTLLWTRSAGGQKATPLHIFHSSDDPYLEPLFAYVESVLALLPFPIEWHSLDTRSRVELGRNRTMDTFPTRHLASGQSLGFRLLERKSKLKADFAHLSQDELGALAKVGKIGEATEEVETLRVAFCGDSLPVEPSLVEGAQLLVHEATILEGEGVREGQNHSSIRDALRVAKESGAGNLLLNHLSRHHSRPELETAIGDAASNLDLRCPVWMLLDGELVHVWSPT